MSAYPNIHCSGFPSPEFCTDLLSGETGRVCSSLEASLSRTRVYRLRKKDTAFAAAWDEAEDIATDSLGDEARRRAIEGWQSRSLAPANAAREAQAAFQSISCRGHRVGRSTNEANSLEPLRGRAASPAHTLNLAWSRSINFYMSSLDFGTRQPRARCEMGRRAVAVGYWADRDPWCRPGSHGHWF
jgi:hypothetical protein